MRGNKYVPFMLKRGDGRTLDLDFTQGVLDSRITFTRASTATFINSSGLVASASTNVPRFDHDPSTLAPRGLLIEGQATNLLNWSESFATSGGTNNNWGDTNITRTSTNNTDPAGGTTALRITASAGNGTIISSAAIGTSAARTFSVWLRRVTGTGDIQYTQNNGTNWNTQAITSSWVRYTFTHTVDHRVGIRIVTSGDAIELWGAQLETGSGASSYIPTAASQATRAIDEATMTSTNFSSWFGSPTSGTMYAQAFATFIPTASNFPSMWRFEKAGIRRMDGFVRHTNGVLRIAGANAASGGTMIDIETSPSTLVTAGVQFKQAVAMSDLSWVYAANAGSGVNTGTNATVYFDETVDSFRIGMSSGVSGSLTVSRLTYWPFALPDATLQSLTQ